MPCVQFLLPKAPTISRPMLERYLQQHPAVEIRITEGSVYDALQLMETAIIASGTATLDAALCEVPMVVLYRTSWPTYLAARAVLRIPYIALVNVVAGREIVPEYVQHRAGAGRLANAVVDLMRDAEKRDAMRANLREVRTKLGEPGAVDRAASIVLSFFNS